MLLFWYNLYLAFFRGTWNEYTGTEMWTSLQTPVNAVGQFLTSIFGDATYNTFGSDIYNSYPVIIAFVLAVITSIGIVVMAAKGVKRAFGIFFGQIR